ncbi:MAG: threonylcarbamoyl-AMP synthase [Bacteroidales bacterium]|jgi:tRNA threonylcarbamoyl adenosine modification protein (Sua5/YciO/YrdC/YwlC family)|nr:threonylcarbamoyl-AMP synthase [Bacteroidales bacterium]
MLIKLYEKNTDMRDVLKAVKILKEGGVVIFPTDTVYGLGCDIANARAVERVARIMNVQIERCKFSFICSGLSHLSDYCKPIPNPVFKLIKSCLPGPYTFILQANSQVPHYFKGKKKTIGFRVPDNRITLELVKELGNPLLSTSVHDEDEIVDYTTDPELIYERYRNVVDAVIDGGFGGNVPSTVVDCTGSEPLVVRYGKGEIDL